MKRLVMFVVLALVAGVGLAAAQDGAAPAPKAPAVDITGQWTASFDTQVGTQTYTYDFVEKDGKLTGKAKSNLVDAPVEIQNGTVDGNVVKFVEDLNFQGTDVQISYTGTITSNDEIKFTRDVAGMATEELVATRVKTPASSTSPQ